MGDWLDPDTIALMFVTFVVSLPFLPFSRRLAWQVWGPDWHQRRIAVGIVTFFAVVVIASGLTFALMCFAAALV